MNIKPRVLLLISLIVLTIVSCKKDNYDNHEVIVQKFNFSKTILFEDSLSKYNIFQASPYLLPDSSFELLELSSVLFTDYAYKQRLVKIPEGTEMIYSNDFTIDFPNGTILTKTFFYYLDERDSSLGKQLIETRLLIKNGGLWNAATYVWNETQSEAILNNNGVTTPISWINASGEKQSTLYEIPKENDCKTCHQSNSKMSPLGPTLLNLNHSVIRNGSSINQLEHLQSKGLINNLNISQIPHMVDYNDVTAPLDDRGRAYLAMNCAHCHNPNAWNESAKKDMDFRYETPFDQTGIKHERTKIFTNIVSKKMPFIGTTMIDDEGIQIVIEYLESIQ